MGTALAHPNFGAFAGDLLIGNFGDGRINAFREQPDGTWSHTGVLKDTAGQPLVLGGLWALQFGRGNAASGAVNLLYYTAGPFGETQGVVGRIIPNPAEIGGTVPATLSLGLGAGASFGAFTPGVVKEYTATTSATVISSAGTATLSVADPSATAPGRLTNGVFALTQPLQVSATSAAAAAAAPAAVSGTPAALLTYDAPISNDAATITFQQSIAATEPLRTGAYTKTLTFTLSTTNP